MPDQVRHDMNIIITIAYMISKVLKIHWSTICLGFILFLILLCKLRLLLVRQFDPDEFAYLHWAWLLTQGRIPYRDFFFYGTPIFLWPLTMLFILPEGPLIAVFGRLMMFSIYGLLLGCTYLTTKLLTQNKITALLSAVILASFPMTFDKTIEIRPDTLMMVLFLGSFLLLTRKKYLLSGMLSAINTLMFLKIIVLLPSLIPLFVVSVKGLKTKIIKFAGGIAIPLVIFLLYLSINGIVPDAWNAVVNISRIVNNDQWGFPPLTGLLPFELVYMEKGGITYPWIINTILLLLSIPGIPILFLKTKKTPSLFLFALLFFLESIALFLLFPRPHMQYFIPLTVIASLFAGITVAETLQFISKRVKIPLIVPLGFSAVSLLLFASIYMQTTDRIRPGNGNTEQLQVLSDIPRVINPTETVYDEVGSYIFRPDGYFICCHHYEQFAGNLESRLWSLKDNLIRAKTKFIVLDQKGFAFWTPKPDDVAFIITHYLESAYKKIYTLGVRFQCNEGACVQLNVHGRVQSEELKTSFDVVIEETYTMRIQPDNQQITINNLKYSDNQTAVFPPGTYRFTVPKNVMEFSIQLGR